MITLATFGPNFGLPDPSPFVVKADVLLKMSGLPYAAKPGDVRKAPKGKLPFIDDDGTVIADTTFIRRHLEAKYGLDFDAGLAPAERAVAWAFEKMCEEHLYFALLEERWLVDANFDKGPRHYFDGIPNPLRPLIATMVRREVRRNLWGQGMGRHARPEILALAASDLDALATYLADKTYLMGDRLSGADATLFAFVGSVLCPHFAGPLRDAAAHHANLVAYVDRGYRRWYPELAAPA